MKKPPRRLFKVPHVDPEWAASRNTHIAVATAIHAITLRKSAEKNRSPDDIYEEPFHFEWSLVVDAVQNYIDRGVFPEEPSGRYAWGTESITAHSRTPLAQPLPPPLIAQNIHRSAR